MFRIILWKKRRTGGSELAGNTAGIGETDATGEWDWSLIYKNAIKAGVSSSEFWSLTLAEYNLIIEAYIDTQKEKQNYDLRLAYYTGCFAQLGEPEKLYNEIVKKLNKKQQSEIEMFNQLKLISQLSTNDVSESNFKIPLNLQPSFDVNVFSYIYQMKDDRIELYLPDTVVSNDKYILEPKDGLYIIDNDLLDSGNVINIKYDMQVYKIFFIRS